MRKIVLALIVSLFATPTMASQYWSGSGWTVFDNSIGGSVSCNLVTRDGDTFSGIILDGDGVAYAHFGNDTWNLNSHSLEGMTMAILRNDSTRPTVYQNGRFSRLASNKMMVQVNDRFLTDYNNGKQLTLYRANSIIATVDLWRSPMGVSRLKQCVREALDSY